MSRRLAAVASLLLLVAAVVLTVVVSVQRFPSGLTVLACVVVALLVAWWALLHRGAARLLGAVVAGSCWSARSFSSSSRRGWSKMR